MTHPPIHNDPKLIIHRSHLQESNLYNQIFRPHSNRDIFSNSSPEVGIEALTTLLIVNSSGPSLWTSNMIRSKIIHLFSGRPKLTETALTSNNYKKTPNAPFHPWRPSKTSTKSICNFLPTQKKTPRWRTHGPWQFFRPPLRTQVHPRLSRCRFSISHHIRKQHRLLHDVKIRQSLFSRLSQIWRRSHWYGTELDCAGPCFSSRSWVWGNFLVFQRVQILNFHNPLDFHMVCPCFFES